MNSQHRKHEITIIIEHSCRTHTHTYIPNIYIVRSIHSFVWLLRDKHVNRPGFRYNLDVDLDLVFWPVNDPDLLIY